MLAVAGKIPNNSRLFGRLGTPVDKPQFQASLLAPRYWPVWLLMGFWWLVAQLPFALQVLMARGLGNLLWRVGGSRRHIAETNIRLCFPGKSEAEREALVRENFFSTAMALFETGIAWFWPSWRLRRLYRVRGLEHLPEHPQQGVLLMAMHFTTLDIGGAFMSQERFITGMYRRHKNPVYDYVQRRGRERHHEETRVIPREDVRGMLKALREGQIVWYAPDQDYGPKQSLFVPLFGVEAATVTATAKFARLGKAQVVPFTQRRLPGWSGYELVIHPPLEAFPQGDDMRDARRINEYIEARILEQPEQYLWAHRRFKTRPPGEARVY